jgi:cytoskeletal protein CcmA (bactofilin family)
MFTRTDKPADANGSAIAPPRDKVEAPPPAPPAVEPKRAAVIAQPIASVAPSSSIPRVSVISKALKITGQLESTEDIQIDGEIDGDVRGMSVKVGSNAKVKGAVYGDEVEVSGTVDGKIEAKRVTLTSTAHMSGDIIHQDITIHSGAFIDGSCKPEFGKADPKRILSVHKPAAVQ